MKVNAVHQTLTVGRTEVRIEGPSGPPGAQPPCIVLLHGWPDTAVLWDATVALLAPHYRCARFTWPGFGRDDEARAYSLDELVSLLHQVVLAVGGGRPVTLLLHDWGCFFGYHFARQHPELVARVVGIDIGDAGSRAHRAAMKPKQMAMVAGYQLWLAAAWKLSGTLGGTLGGALGDRMARWMARALRVPTPQGEIRAKAGYPYWLTWTGRYRAARPFAPTVPTFFAYGKRKPFMFHSPAWCDDLATRPGCRVEGLRAGHWVMLDAAPAFHAALLAWLSATDSMASAAMAPPHQSVLRAVSRPSSPGTDV